MAIARIRKNDTVIVTCGNDAGKTGTVIKVDPKKGTAVVNHDGVSDETLIATVVDAGFRASVKRGLFS